MDLLQNVSDFTGFCSQPHTVIRDLTDPQEAILWLYSDTDRLIIKVIIPIVSFLGIFGNATFLCMCVRVTELRRAPVTAYLVNLAICDIAFLVSSNVVYSQAIKSRTSAEWPVDSALDCSALSIFTFSWYYVSLGFVTLISVERYFAVCHPLKRINVNRKGRNSKLIAAVWMLGFAFGISVVPQYAHFTYYCVIWPNTSYFQDLPNMIKDCELLDDVAVIWGSLISILSLVLTMIGNIWMYVEIIQALRKRPTSSASSKADIIIYQVTRTLVANGIIFFICQLPYRLWTLDDLVDRVFDQVDILHSLKYETLTITVGRACALLNSTINPYLYVFSCEHYRGALLKMMKTFCGQRKSGGNESSINSVSNSTHSTSQHNTVSQQNETIFGKGLPTCDNPQRNMNLDVEVQQV